MKSLKIILTFVSLFAWVVCIAQNNGIDFLHGFTWPQILSKAKNEGKYVFVDCYATWCVPCKRMDREVYNLSRVGKEFNEKFISIKIQIDSSSKDDIDVKRLYQDAQMLRREFNVQQLPSFLFFSPEGNIVHKDFGFRQPDELINIAKNVLDTAWQYYTLIKLYKAGKRNYEKMDYIAKMAKALGDNNLANVISSDYLHNYLYRLTDEQLYKKEYLEFISQFVKKSKDKGFRIFYNNQHTIDSLVKFKGFAQRFVDNIITREDIDPYLWDKDHNPIVIKPDWQKLFTSVKKKYGLADAERILLNSKVNWYSFKKDWPEIVRYNIERIEKYGLDTSGLGKYFLNNLIFDIIFKHSDDDQSIDKGILWMEMLLKTESDRPSWLDTYANLLYKRGKIKKAIEIEKKALEIAAALKDEDSIKEFQETIDKMQKGIPTW